MTVANPAGNRDRKTEPFRSRGEQNARVSLIRALTTGLRYLPLIAALAFVGLLVSGIRAYRQPRTYSANGSFIPNARKSPSNLSGIAAQFGLNVQIPEGGQSPAFYVDLLATRQIADRIIKNLAEDSGATRELAAALPPLASERDRLLGRREFARGAVHAGVSQSTGVVTISATTKSPTLSAAVATAALRALDAFNREHQRTQAAAERAFTEQRLAIAKAELTAAETRLQEFSDRNRGYQSSAELNLQHDRFQRDAFFAQQVYATLAQSFEQARIDEVRDMPQLTIIEAPEAPTVPNPRGTVSRGLLGALFGAILGVIVMLVREFFDDSRVERGDELAELTEVRAELLNRLRHPLRMRSSRGERPSPPM